MARLAGSEPEAARLGDAGFARARLITWDGVVEQLAERRASEECRLPGSAPDASVLVIVPTYNERENLGVLVPRLLAIEGLRVLIVDDGSPDGTGAEADRLATASGGRLTVMHRTGPRGLGRSYVDGMQAAVTAGVRFICQMDADLSHDPDDLATAPRGRRRSRPRHRLALRSRAALSTTGLATASG